MFSSPNWLLLYLGITAAHNSRGPWRVSAQHKPGLALRALPTTTLWVQYHDHAHLSGQHREMTVTFPRSQAKRRCLMLKGPMLFIWPADSLAEENQGNSGTLQTSLTITCTSSRPSSSHFAVSVLCNPAKLLAKVSLHSASLRFHRISRHINMDRGDNLLPFFYFLFFPFFLLLPSFPPSFFVLSFVLLAAIC